MVSRAGADNLVLDARRMMRLEQAGRFASAAGMGAAMVVQVLEVASAGRLPAMRPFA